MKLQAFHKIQAYDDEARCRLLMDTHNQIFVQPKLNGVSCQVSYGIAEDCVIFQSRTGKRWRPDFFPLARQDFLKMRETCSPRLTFHCEIHAVDPTVPLATLAGWVNVNRDQYHPETCGAILFTVFDITKDFVAEPFVIRNTRLRDFKHEFGKIARVSFLPATVLYKAEDMEEAYQSYTRQGGEGVVYRCNPCYYFDGDQETPHGWKRPKYYTAEGTIIAAMEGEGKRKGMLGAFIIRLDDGQTVLSVGGGDGIDDAALTNYWENYPNYIRQRLTFRYSELSKHGTPLRPQIVSIRNYE